ncbi:tripartite tricarboxylate transporter substrate binding protein [Alcaligenaceae bacterium]|nr:tripartite tricarboxylate transporter substrate binding protein [Alcaligenaceae bacterium]
MRKSFAWLLAGLIIVGFVAVIIARAHTSHQGVAGDTNYPNRPVTLVVTFPPGGGTDLLARRLAASLEPELGQTVVVDNRAGASGNIGAQAVARAKPDGYTLLVANSSYAINPGVYRQLGFSPQTDLVGVINVAFVPSVLVTAAGSAWSSLQQALDVNEAPGAAAPAYASCGNGTPQHLAGEMLVRRAGAAWLHVPYRGCGPALSAVLAGNVELGLVTASSALPFLQAGTLRALAVTSPQRSPLLPDVASVAEQGWPGYELDQWHGLLAPAGTAPAIIERLNSAIARVMRRTDVEQGLQALGYDTTISSALEFQTMIQQDIARFAELTQEMGLRVD